LIERNQIASPVAHALKVLGLNFHVKSIERDPK